MLGTQVAVAIDDAAVPEARCDESAALRNEAALHRVDAPDQPSRQRKARIEQHAAVIGERASDLGELHRLRQHRRLRRAVEIRQHIGKAIDVPGPEAALRDQPVEHEALIEPLHMHQPIDWRSVAAEREAPCGLGERHDAEIDVRREPPVEPDLSAAGQFAPHQRREIEIGEPYRLLQLEDVVADEKHPRHMRLAGDHGRRRGPVSIGTAKKSDFVGERGRGMVAIYQCRRHGLLHAMQE